MLRLFFLALGLIFFPQSLCFLILLPVVLRQMVDVLNKLRAGQSKKYSWASLGGVLQILILGSALVACAPGIQPQTSIAQTLPTPEGMASWYGAEFAGRPTSNGEIYDPSQMTAAHRTLPFGTFIKVINIKNGLNVVVRVNDRGPFAKGRIIDVSRAAAEILGMIGPGIAQVRLELISNEPAPAAHPETNTVIAADAALATYNVISSDYLVGQLLMLSSPTQPNVIIVRVASNTMPVSSGVNMFVSNALFSMLGEHVTVIVGN
jgi:rare lipoprotein A